MAISRRGFLIGGAATVGVVAVGVVGGGLLVEEGVLPGKSKLDEVLGRCGDALEPPDVEPGPITTGTFTSAARNGAEVGWTVIRPPGSADGDALPVCLFLHGRGGNHTDATGPMELPRFLAGAVGDGVAPFAIASVDGGDAVNWHRRADGDDPARMISDELLPLLAAQGLDVDRPAFWGVSLGGTGALYLATLPQFSPAGVVAASPALWRDPGEWQAGAYDDADDFAANNLWNRRDLLDGIELRIDCGESDPFASRVRQFRDSLDPLPAGGIEAGCHDTASGAARPRPSSPSSAPPSPAPDPPGSFHGVPAPPDEPPVVRPATPWLDSRGSRPAGRATGEGSADLGHEEGRELGPADGVGALVEHLGDVVEVVADDVAAFLDALDAEEPELVDVHELQLATGLGLAV